MSEMYNERSRRATVMSDTADQDLARLSEEAEEYEQRVHEGVLRLRAAIYDRTLSDEAYLALGDRLANTRGHLQSLWRQIRDLEQGAPS